MKVIENWKGWILLVLLAIGLSACGSSRLNPQVHVGIPMKKGKAPDVGFTWY